MISRSRQLVIVFIATLILFQANPAAPNFANDGSPTVSGAKSQLQNSVRRLNAWLSKSDDAQKWRRYLLLNILETQTAMGDQANTQTLMLIRARFNQDNKALKHPAFNDVRLALDAQINRLGGMMQGDLQNAVMQAQGMYTRTTIGQMAYQRDLAVYELKLLKKYYRATLRSRKRAGIFYDLELDEAIEFLQDIEFQLPPEVSTGKLTSMIRDIEKQMDEVEKQLDALPATPEPDEDEDEGDDENKDDDQPELTPQIEMQFPLGPIPDSNEKTKSELEQEKKMIDARIEALKEQRRKVAEADKPRSTLRTKTFRRLRQLESNFVKLSKKQSDPYFVSAAMTFDQFFRTYVSGTNDNLQEVYLRKLEDISDNLTEITSGDLRTGTGELGENLRWLENANQVPGLVAAIRARYSNPNLYVGVSGKLIGQIGSQNISTSEMIRENMGGQLARGSAQINANVNVELQNDPNQIHANIRLTGDLASAIYLEKFGVQVFTGANGHLEAARAIYANIGGLFSTDPKVAANISAYLAGTSSRLRLVNKIAQKKFWELKSKSEGTTARRTEEQLRGQFESQTEDALKQGEKGLRRAQDALLANANLAPQVYLRSTNTQIVAVGKKSSISTLGAPDYPLAYTIPTDVGVRVHESLLSNFLDRTFSGLTLTDKQLAEELGDMLGGVELPAFTPEDDEEDNSFSITFNNVRPIQFEFDDNALGISIAGQRFTKGGREINTGLRIGMRFKIKRIEGKLKLVRDGKATLDFIGKKDAKSVTIRSLLDARLNPKEGGDPIEIELPDNLLPIEQVKVLKDSDFAKQMKLVQCRSEKGWLYLGWNYQPENFYFQSQMDVPAIWTEATIVELSPLYTDSDQTNLPQSVNVGSTAEPSSPPSPIESAESTPMPMESPNSPTPMPMDSSTKSSPPPLPTGAVVIEGAGSTIPSAIEGQLKR